MRCLILKTTFRKNTIRLYLNQLQKNSSKLNVIDFADYSYQKKGVEAESSDPTLLAWYYFQLSQYWHIVSTSCLCHLLTALQNTSGSGWIQESELVILITNEVLEELKSMAIIDNSTLFSEIDEPEDEALILSRKTNTNNPYLGIANTFLF